MAVTIPPGFDKALALKLANASMLAYDQLSTPAQFTMPPGYTLAANSPPTCSGIWSCSHFS